MRHKLLIILFLSLFLNVSYNLKIDQQNISVVFAGDILKTGKKLYSQHNEELIVRDFFNDRKRGIFVDVGCADYRDMSTTYYLESHLEWSGIAVDALAEFAIGYIKNRPNTRFFNFIVTDHSGGIEPFYRVLNATGLSSVNENYAKEAPEYHHVTKGYQVIYVPTITLTDLLERNGIAKIDFLSIDIEGSEPASLSGFDIEKFRPKLVCIESQEKNKDKIMNYFINHGYERIDKYLEYDRINWYFKPEK